MDVGGERDVVGYAEQFGLWGFGVGPGIARGGIGGHGKGGYGSSTMRDRPRDAFPERISQVGIVLLRV